MSEKGGKCPASSPAVKPAVAELCLCVLDDLQVVISLLNTSQHTKAPWGLLLEVHRTICE